MAKYQGRGLPHLLPQSPGNDGGVKAIYLKVVKFAGGNRYSYERCNSTITPTLSPTFTYQNIAWSSSGTSVLTLRCISMVPLHL